MSSIAVRTLIYLELASGLAHGWMMASAGELMCGLLVGTVAIAPQVWRFANSSILGDWEELSDH